MSKTIAERFLLHFRGIDEKSGQPYQKTPLHFLDVKHWLNKQPENNQPLFTLAQVEAIAREAVEEVQYSYENIVLFNDDWWSNKLKELGQ